MRDDTGRLLGFNGANLRAELRDAAAGWTVAQSESRFAIQAPQSGDARLTLSYPDAGVTRQLALRVAGSEEASALSLSAEVFSGIPIIVCKAVVLTRDGGTFFEPPVQWSPDPRLVERDFGFLLGGLPGPRRDVRVYGWRGEDAGTFQTQVGVSVNGLDASVQLEVTVPPREVRPSPRIEPQATPCGCGAGAGGAPLLGMLAGAVLAARGILRRGRRAAR